MKRVLFWLISLSCISSAHAVQVVSSIKPIHLITQQITLDTASSSALLNAAMSPHDYALKPSDVKKLRNADLVVWFGPELETFMSALLQGQENTLTISHIPTLDLRDYAAAEDHDGHNHGSIDPHFWLGPKQVSVVARAIAEKLIEIDPVNRSKYEQNLDAFLNELQVVALKINNQLAPVRDNGYFVFHDGYGYFEEYFNLNHLGYFTVSPERKPGARTLIQIKQRLAKGDVHCVFSEPQYTPAVIETVVRGSTVNMGELDPLATNIVEQQGAYFVFLEQLGSQFETCLK